MTIIENIKADLITTRKNKDKEVTGMLQMLLATIQNESIAKKDEIGEEEVVAIVKKDIAKYQEVLEATDTQETRAKILILENYIPKQMDKDEIIALLEEKGAKKGMKIGQLMGMVMSTHKQFVDGNLVRVTIQEKFL